MAETIEEESSVSNDAENAHLRAVEEERPRLSGWQRTGLGLLSALTVTTSLAGAAGYAARHLPVCEPESSVVEISPDGVCVSPDISNKVGGIQRVARGHFHQSKAVDDLVSESNRILQPKEPRTGNLDGQFTVNSWNLHHGTSHSKTGARPQLDLQIAHLKTSDADVDLLQEVLPWHAQKLVDGTGKVGYYSQTTPRQGNLILVSPEFKVTDNTRQTLNYLVETREEAADIVDRKGEREPRAAQLLQLQGADTGKRLTTVFNTHLSTRSASQELRESEHQVLEEFLDEHASRGSIMVGGGDLNTRDGVQIVQNLRDRGYTVEGATIDWLVSSPELTHDVQRVDVTTGDGTYVSDHPLVRGSYTIK